MRYALRINSDTSLSGYTYLQEVQRDGTTIRVIYINNPDEAMTWPTGAEARAYKARPDMPGGLGRVVKL